MPNKRAVALMAITICAAIAIGITFVARPEPCTGNVMQDDLMACGLKIGDQK